MIEPMNPDSETRCKECGSPVFLADAAGLCPGCLLEGALDPRVEDADNGLQMPKTCGGYVLEREIGRGGSGVVFLATLPGIERKFAIKMPATHFSAADEIRRFRIEIESVTKLEHPNIVPVHFAGEELGRPFLVMKYADGGSLRTLIESRRGLAVDDKRADVLRMVKVARAIQFAHERGVLHRDLKPANILLDENGEPLVADFGLARLMHAPSGGTISGSAIGTPAYMAPEQAMGSTVTTAVDIYSLGAVLFHLLTNQPPFSGETPMETLRQVAGGEVPDPRKLVPGLDRDLATICLKCMNSDPLRRYHTASDLADDLERWLRDEPVLARPAGTLERITKWSRRHPAAAALAVFSTVAAAAFIILLGVGTLALRREKNEALLQESIALGNAALARDAADAFRQNSYAADIYLASRAIDDGQLGVARTMLARHEPLAGQDDLRGFEWFALQDRCTGEELRTFRDHRAAVTCVAFDPTGKFVASGSRDGRLLVYDVASGRQVLELPAAVVPKGVTEIPMMTRLAARSPDMMRMILSGEVTPDEMRMRARPSKLGEFTAISWSPDGTLLATASTGSYIRLWKMPQGELIGFLPFNAVKQVAFSAEGGLLVSHRIADKQSVIRIHRVSDLTEVRALHDVQPAFTIAGGRLAFMRNGSQRMEIQNLESGKELQSWEADMGISSVVLSRDGETLLGVDPWGRESRSWRSRDGKLLSVEKAEIGAMRIIAIDPDGHRRVTGGTDQSITIRPIDGGDPRDVLSGHEDEILALAVSPDGRMIASGSTDRTLRLWQSPVRPGGSAPSVSNELSTVDASPDGRMWLASSNHGGIVLQSFGRGPRSLADPGERKPLGFDESGGQFLTWRMDRNDALIEWWDCESLTVLDTRRISPGFPGPWVMRLSPRGRLLGCCGSRTPVVVFDLKDGSVAHHFPPPELLPVRMEFSPDESKILIAAWPRTARVGRIGANWNPSFHLTTGTVGPIVFSPDGRLLVSGGDDNTISVRDSETGRLLRELRGHRSQIMALAFTPDGRSLASSGADRTLRLWHTSTWRSLGAIDADRLHGFIRFDTKGQKLLVVPWQEDAFWIPRDSQR